MLVNIQIPDELYQAYAERRPERPQQALTEALKEFRSLAPGQFRVVLEGDSLKELNALLGHPISSPAELLEHLKRSQRVSLGDGVEIQLTTAQRTRLKDQATFWLRPGEDPEKQFREHVSSGLQRAINQVTGL